MHSLIFNVVCYPVYPQNIATPFYLYHSELPNNKYMYKCIYMVMECTFRYSGGFKFCPVLFFSIIVFNGSLKKVENSKYIKQASDL